MGRRRLSWGPSIWPAVVKEHQRATRDRMLWRERTYAQSPGAVAALNAGDEARLAAMQGEILGLELDRLHLDEGWVSLTRSLHCGAGRSIGEKKACPFPRGGRGAGMYVVSVSGGVGLDSRVSSVARWCGPCGGWCNFFTHLYRMLLCGTLEVQQGGQHQG